MCQTEKQIRAKAPQRPYANFAKFCLRYLSAERVALGKCPCLVCYGRGWLYHPDSESDPVEGNKHRETIDCQTCDGTGEGDKKVVRKAYIEIIAKWHASITHFKARATRRKRALAKLTQEEIDALIELGV